MNEGTRNRRETRAGSLKERFKSNIHMIKKKKPKKKKKKKKTAWKDEKNFTLEVDGNS